MMILHCRGEVPSLSTRILWVGGSLGEIKFQKKFQPIVEMVVSKDNSVISQELLNSLKSLEAWPGRDAGIRKPEPGETPLSAAEIRFAVWRSIVKKNDVAAIAIDEQADEVDTLPVQRSHKLAGMWERRNVGLMARPSPWEGLAR